MFMPTAIIPVSIILLMTIVINMNDNREAGYILVNKINYWIECFEEFTLSIFIIMSGAYLYYCIDSSGILQNILSLYATIEYGWIEKIKQKSLRF